MYDRVVPGMREIFQKGSTKNALAKKSISRFVQVVIMSRPSSATLFTCDKFSIITHRARIH